MLSTTPMTSCSCPMWEFARDRTKSTRLPRTSEICWFSCFTLVYALSKTSPTSLSNTGSRSSSARIPEFAREIAFWTSEERTSDIFWFSFWTSSSALLRASLIRGPSYSLDIEAFIRSSFLAATTPSAMPSTSFLSLSLLFSVSKSATFCLSLAFSAFRVSKSAGPLLSSTYFFSEAICAS